MSAYDQVSHNSIEAAQTYTTSAQKEVQKEWNSLGNIYSKSESISSIVPNLTITSEQDSAAFRLKSAELKSINPETGMMNCGFDKPVKIPHHFLEDWDLRDVPNADQVKAANDKFDEIMKKNPPPEGCSPIVARMLGQAILSGDIKAVQNLVKATKTPEDLATLSKTAEYVAKQLCLGIKVDQGDNGTKLNVWTSFSNKNDGLGFQPFLSITSDSASATLGGDRMDPRLRFLFYIDPKNGFESRPTTTALLLGSGLVSSLNNNRNRHPGDEWPPKKK